MDRDYRGLRNGSDIRGGALAGVEGEEVNLTPEAARRLAQGFVAWLSERCGRPATELTVAVGRDPRLSGADLLAAFEEGALELGVRLVDCGLATTPAMFMTCVLEGFEADGSCMVTASHLPWNRNGLKFFSSDGGLETADSGWSGAAAGSAARRAALPCAEGAVERRDVLGPYAAHLRSIIQAHVGGERPLEGLSICVDAGNGSAGFYATDVLEPLGADVSASQFLEPDGSFPNHMPNPENAEAMASVSARVRERGCDLGVIFDTDVDRASAVDAAGNEINRNAIIALAGALVAETHPGTTVVTDSVTSDELHEFLEGELGLRHLRYQRGYRNVINKMCELNDEGVDCQLAIETSGHAAFLENYALDDGSYLATRIIVKAAKLAREGRTISDLLAGLSEPAESEEVRMGIAGEGFQATGDRVLADLDAWVRGEGAALAAARGMELEVVEPNYEGIRVAVSGDVHGWFLLRKSLHDPLMPLNVESSAEGGCAAIRALLREALAGEEGLDVSGL